MLAVLSFSSAYVLPAGAPARSTAAVARAAPSTMDETILQRALEGVDWTTLTLEDGWRPLKDFVARERAAAAAAAASR